jgi:hypothetical protein
MYVDCAFVYLSVTPDAVHQLGAGEHPARLLE